MKQASFSTSSPLQHESTCQLLFLKKPHYRLVQLPEHQVFHREEALCHLDEESCSDTGKWVSRGTTAATAPPFTTSSTFASARAHHSYFRMPAQLM